MHDREHQLSADEVLASVHLTIRHTQAPGVLASLKIPKEFLALPISASQTCSERS